MPMLFEMVPHKDMFEHEPGEGCWCEPYWDDECCEDPDCDGCTEPLLIHKAMDNREEYERGRRKPH